MTTAQRQVLMIRANALVKETLHVISTCYLDEAGAGALMDASVKLESVVFNFRLVASDIRQSIAEARETLRQPDMVRIINEIDRLSSFDRQHILDGLRSALDNVVSRNAAVSVSSPLQQASSASVSLPKLASKSPDSVLESRPVWNPKPTKGRPRQRRRVVSRERGLELFAELERSLTAARSGLKRKE